MAERARRDPTMEEIVVALRETKRRSDRAQPLTVVAPRGNRPIRGIIGSSDLVDLRDDEIGRLLEENARLNARIVSLLKVMEQEQAIAAEAASYAAPAEVDRAAIYKEVRAAVEAELSPILLVLLRMLEKRHGEVVTGNQHGSDKLERPAASDWIVELMQRLDNDTGATDEPVSAPEAAARRGKLRERMADVINAFRLDPYAPTPRRFTSPEGHP